MPCRTAYRAGMAVGTLNGVITPPHDCPLCPRLVAFREEQRASHPDWFNAPVPDFGDPHAWLAIVGLAPGLQGANRTGRPFTGDYSGGLLYETLAKFGLSEGAFEGRPDDGIRLKGAIIVSAVRCVPPQNKPTPDEIRTCRRYLEPSLHALPELRVVVALGHIAHQSAVKAFGGKLPKIRFGHGAEHRLPSGPILLDSYHCSRYNQNTGRLTAAMFEEVFARAVALSDGAVDASKGAPWST
jgi:uracil-DNA glycosylase family 4